MPFAVVHHLVYGLTFLAMLSSVCARASSGWTLAASPLATTVPRTGGEASCAAAALAASWHRSRYWDSGFAVWRKENEF